MDLLRRRPAGFAAKLERWIILPSWKRLASVGVLSVDMYACRVLSVHQTQSHFSRTLV